MEAAAELQKQGSVSSPYLSHPDHVDDWITQGVHQHQVVQVFVQDIEDVGVTLQPHWGQFELHYQGDLEDTDRQPAHHERSKDDERGDEGFAADRGYLVVVVGLADVSPSHLQVDAHVHGGHHKQADKGDGKHGVLLLVPCLVDELADVEPVTIPVVLWDEA